MQFIRDSYREFEKITWPSRTLSLGHTLIVIAVCILIGYYSGLFDSLFTQLLKAFV